MFIRWPTHHQKLHEHVGRGLFTNLKGDGDAQWIMSIFFLPGGFLGGRRGWSTKSGPHGYELASQRFPVLTKNAIQRAIFAVPTGAGQGPGTGAGCSGLIATKTGHTWSQRTTRTTRTPGGPAPPTPCPNAGLEVSSMAPVPVVGAPGTISFDGPGPGARVSLLGQKGVC